MEYIERKRVLELVREKLLICESLPDTIVKEASVFTLVSVISSLDSIPAADARQVVHGAWRKHRFSETVYGFECSVCRTTWDMMTDFCPFCGADMGEVKK